MEATVTASDMRHEFAEIVRRVRRGETLIVVSRSRPVFRIVPMRQAAGNVAWLDRVHTATDVRPTMKQISRVVHQIRRCGR